MRPKLAMWSDYGTPAQKHWMSSASKRGARTSIGPKILLAAVMVVAGVIGISGIYPQVIDAEWVQDASGTHLPKMSPPPADVTTKRSGIVAAIPLPPRRAVTTGQAAVSPPGSALAPELSQLRTSVGATSVGATSVNAAEPQAETATPLAIAAVPDAEAKADDPADPAAAAAKPADKPKVAMVKKKVVVHRQRSYAGAYAQSGGWGGWGGGGGGLFQPFGGNYRRF
jgi:hypothetical protein